MVRFFMRDVQMLSRHSSLSMTQRYIDADIDAQRKIVDFVESNYLG